MDEFEQAFEVLNAQQRQAVETIDGPVLVIAGPGTGKTQLLSMRVANILKSTDAKPSNILCLTFTNKAAVNMKDRIIELAGYEGARVPACTFHSFAAEIMNLYPDNFWSAARMSIAPDSVQLDIIESIVKQLPLDHPLALQFAGQYTLLKAIQRSIGLAKDAGLTPAKLQALVEFNLSYIDEIEGSLVEVLGRRLSVKTLPALAAEIEGLSHQEIRADLYPLTSLHSVINDSLAQAVDNDLEIGKCTATSKWKSRWLQVTDGQKGMFNERQRNRWWEELSGVYASYREELHRRGFYDYADMLVETIAQLEQNPGMLADVQERFNYVLVDEFQDSTPAQLRFAHLIAEHHTSEGKPNLMVVGDDDQTIFKFNGAKVNNMLNFERYYPALTKIVLSDSYRSSQKILDFAKAIIEQAETRLVKLDPSLTKKLVAKNAPRASSEIRTLAYSSSELQMSEIARDIKRRYQPDETIAVLARGHGSLVAMAGILNQLKVPLRYEQSTNILDHQIIEQLYLVAKLLIAIRDGDSNLCNSLLHKILRWPAWGLEPYQLWRLAEANFSTPKWLEALLDSRDKPLRSIGAWFVWLARQADIQPLAITIEQIIGLRDSNGFVSPVRDFFLKDTKQAPNDYFHGLSAIQLLRNLVHEFGREKQPTLDDLVRYFEINKLNGVIVADESPFITGHHTVQLLSVHKAKGLEFDHVYIIDAIDDYWRPKGGGRKPPANLPLQPPGDDFDDYVRLMYVAVTRARSSLSISGHYQDHSGKDVSLSSIIQSVKPFIKISETNQQELISVIEKNLRWPQLSAGDERAILKARLEDFSLNVTHLLHFLDIANGGPQYFKERHLLRLPEVKTPSQSYGTAIHAALHRAQHLANRRRFSLAAVDKEFEAALREEQMIPADFQRYLEKGRRTLQQLFDKLGYQIPQASLGEYQLRDVRLGPVRLSGILDRVDKTQDIVNIVDYKTGRPLASLETKDQNQALKAYRHKLQLIFYSLLLESKEGVGSKISGQMVYVEAASVKQLSLRYIPSPDDKTRLTKLIEAVWTKIQAVDFPNISQYPKSLEGIKRFEEDLINDASV